MYGQGRLETRVDQRGKPDELTELVDLQPETSAIPLDRAKRSAPVGDGREPSLCVSARRRRARPVLEYHRRDNRSPAEIASGDHTIGQSDTAADSEIQIMPGYSGTPLLDVVPHLSEAGVEVDIGAPPEG